MTEQDRETVLVVDDEDLVRQLLTLQLERAGYVCLTAASAREARRVLEETPCSLVLSDIGMPGESGLDLLAGALERYPELAAIVVSGDDNPGTADAAAQLGVYGYMVKPFSEKQLLINVANALRERALRLENRRYREHLEELVDERTSALDEALRRLGRLADQLNASREETIRRLSVAGEYRDEDTGDHVARVAWISESLGRGLALSPDECDLLRTASPLHDIGKVGIPDAILRKPGALDDHERALMQTHAEIGHRILAGSDSPVLDLAATIALVHHEKFDGSGYPRGLSGDEIPIEGRVVAVADVFDALTHDRVYRRRFSRERAVEIVRSGRGTHFDPDVVDVFLEQADELGALSDGIAPGSRTRVLIVEADDQARNRIERDLCDEGHDVVGAVATAAHAFPIAHTRRPDVALVDVDGLASAEVELVRRLALEPGGPRVLAHTSAEVPRGLELVAGIVSKRCSAADLAAAVRDVASGSGFRDPLVQPPDRHGERLTPREREILTLLARGLGGDQIAAELVLSPETVRTHIRNAMAKLSAHSRLHAVTEALRRQEISL